MRRVEQLDRAGAGDTARPRGTPSRASRGWWPPGPRCRVPPTCLDAAATQGGSRIRHLVRRLPASRRRPAWISGCMTSTSRTRSPAHQDRHRRGRPARPGGLLVRGPPLQGGGQQRAHRETGWAGAVPAEPPSSPTAAAPARDLAAVRHPDDPLPGGERGRTGTAAAVPARAGGQDRQEPGPPRRAPRRTAGGRRRPPGSRRWGRACSGT